MICTLIVPERGKDMEKKDCSREYDELTKALFSRHKSVQSGSFGDAYDPGLEKMEAFAALLGNPQEKFRTIHVAGTNGKGSVANMLASCLSSAGFRTGLYTSPHLLDFRERARIAFQGESHMVPREYVCEFIKTWQKDMDSLGLSFFEVTTGLAFKWFADSGVDVAVIEAGMGGRLDSTNIITPELSIVTSIGLDHCQWLGDTRALIAAEKAGIFKHGVPALIGESDPETSPVFEEAAWMTCPLSFADKGEPSLWFAHEEILKAMDLQGATQEKNLRTVLSALDILKGIPYFAPLKDADLRHAIETTATAMDFHGRWERLCDNPYVICDIGHNAAALKYNFAQLEKLVADGNFSSLIIIYGIMADKDLDPILPLMPSKATYIFTTPSTSRALPAGDIASRYTEFCKSQGIRTSGIYTSSSVSEAVTMAMKLFQQLAPWDVKAPSPLIYIGGSTFVVAEAVPYFAKRR